MTRPVFEQCYSALRSQFGVNYFGTKKAEQLSDFFKEVDDADLKKCIDLILASEMYSSDRPPKFEAFQETLTKVLNEKKRAEFRNTQAKQEFLSWDSINQDGLTKALKSLGYQSTQDLVQNGFKPRKV